MIETKLKDGTVIKIDQSVDINLNDLTVTDIRGSILFEGNNLTYFKIGDILRGLGIRELNKISKQTNHRFPLFWVSRLSGFIKNRNLKNPLGKVDQTKIIKIAVNEYIDREEKKEVKNGRK